MEPPVNEGRGMRDEGRVSPPDTHPPTPDTGKYIYCIIDSDISESFGPIGIPKDQSNRGSAFHTPHSALPQLSDVYVIGDNAIGAVVSDSPLPSGDTMPHRVPEPGTKNRELQRNRDNLIAHERAIETVMRTHTVLPARFSTIAESEGIVTRILSREHDRFVKLLTEIKGKLESA